MAEGVQLRFIEQMPLDAQHGWQRSEMVTAAEIRDRLSGTVRAGGGRAGRPAPGQRARRAVPGGGHRLCGGHHRLGVEAVLWRLRPGPADRRRAGPQLPVRADRVRPAHAAAGRGRRRPRSPGGGWRPYGANRPDTASTTPASCSRTGRCRPSAAEHELPAVSRRRASRRRQLDVAAGTAAARTGTAQAVAVVGTGQPVLAPLRRVDLGVVPAAGRTPPAAGSPSPSRAASSGNLAWSRCARPVVRRDRRRG